jgi:hypothetical protein
MIELEYIGLFLDSVWEDIFHYYIVSPVHSEAILEGK